MLEKCPELNGFMSETGVRKVLSLLSLPQVCVSCLVTSTTGTKLRVNVHKHGLLGQGEEGEEKGVRKDWNAVEELLNFHWPIPQNDYAHYVNTSYVISRLSCFFWCYVSFGYIQYFNKFVFLRRYVGNNIIGSDRLDKQLK